MLVGHSYAGSVISNAATQVDNDPSRTGGWVLVLPLFSHRARQSAGLTANRREIARVIWTRNSPKWRFDDATLERTALAFDNPDHVVVVIHSYRHRLGLAPGYAPYQELEERLAQQPVIPVPAITLDGLADGTFPATEGAASAGHFTGPRVHYQVPDAGHNLPQEAPEAFADAVLEVAKLRS